MLIVNGIVFSHEIWNWYAERKQDVHLTCSQKWYLHALRSFLPKQYFPNQFSQIILQDLTAAEFWEILNITFYTLSDLQHNDNDGRMPTNINIQSIRSELQHMEAMIVFWATTKDHTKEKLGLPNIDSSLIVNETGLNLKFAAHAYCMINSCFESLSKCTSILPLHAPPDHMATTLRQQTMPSNTNEFGTRHEQFDDFFKNIIRVAYGGDFDEYIDAVIEDIESKKIGTFHEILARIKGYELMDQKDVTTKLPPSESWRRLFNTYFDKQENNFDMFYQTFTAECIFFILKDYLAIYDNDGISYLPIYKLYSNDHFTQTYSTNIRFLIDTKKIRSQLKKLYNIRI